MFPSLKLVPAPIPPLFAKKKASILAALATPEESYSDLSPKGSVDAKIRSLIDRINGIEGVVTTSSCAGRISVFLEGEKAPKAKQSNGIAEDEGGEDEDRDTYEDTSLKPRATFVPGGKGMGGRWLFVSHDPVEIPIAQHSQDSPVTRLFNFASGDGDASAMLNPNSRFVKFQFEPMILHIMTASLYHAQPILAAAINAGFRESGVQSLKNLHDPNAFPMVAVRTAGLATSSMVGYAKKVQDGEEQICSLVSEQYLQMMLNTANARFQANEERIQRLDSSLCCDRRSQRTDWEVPQLRRERKRAGGLREKQTLHDRNRDAEDCLDLDHDTLPEQWGMDAAS